MDPTQLTMFEHPRAAFRLEIDPSWEVDTSGIDSGVVIIVDPAPMAMGFHLNLVLTQAPLQGADDDPPATLEDQRAVETTIEEQLEDYRLLHLDVEEFGDPPARGAMRVASYTTAEEIPVAMQQWVARARGVELSMTVTFAMADFVAGSAVAWSLARLLTWKDPA